MSMNQGMNALWFGAKGDGVTDDSDIINGILQQFANVYLPPERTYCITKPLVVPDGKSLVSSGNGATIRMMTANVAGIEVGHQSAVETLTIQTAAGNTAESACAIKIRTSPLSTRARIRGIGIRGTDFTSNGICIKDTQNYVAFTVIENIYCDRLKTAVRFEMTPPAYANGMIMNNIVIRSTKRGFYFDKGSEANVVNNVQWNSGTQSIEVIYAESNYNQWNGWYYDLGVNGYTSTLARFAGTGEGNIIRSAGVYNPSWTIADTTPNKLNYLKADMAVIQDQIMMSSYLPHAFLTSADYKKWGYWYRFKPYEGEQDNILAYADKLSVVSNTGVQLGAGILGKAFDPFGYLSTDKPLWQPSTGQYAVVEIEIREPDTTTKRLDFMQVVFSPGAEAKYVKFEYYDPDTSTWKTAKEITNNDKRYAYWHMDVQGVARVTKLRYTMGNPAVPATGIKVERFVARMLCSTGLTFVPRGGGTIVGDMNFYDPSVGPVVLNPNKTQKYRIGVDDAGNVIGIPC